MTEMVEAALARIAGVDSAGPMLRSVIAVDPSAAPAVDDGPLHGIPVLVKDNIDTVDLPTTAGSLALQGVPVVADAPLVSRLRDAGAVILGKTNLSEWANFRSGASTSGWSAVGGLCVNPWALDRSAGGSSSGSAVAVAAGIVRFAVGTETDGSIVCPASLCGVVGLKPTVGLIPGEGIVPVAHSQDTAGPLTRTVKDAARLLEVLADRSYVETLDASPGLKGMRIGVPRKGLWGYSAAADNVCEEAIRLLAAHGADIVDNADLPGLEELEEARHENVVLHTEFKANIEAYLATRPGGPKTLQELIAFNEEHVSTELAHFGQERFFEAEETGGLSDPAYLTALSEGRRLGGKEGIDAALGANDVDVLLAPSYPPAWKIDLVNGDHVTGGCSSPAAVAGYPILSVPAGLASGLPVGLAIMGTAWSEPMLLRVGHAFEQAVGFAIEPTFRIPETG